MTQTEVAVRHQLESISGHNILLNVDTEGQKVIDWVTENAGEIDELVERSGAVLIRGLKIMSSKQFGQILKVLFGEELSNYKYRSTPRTELRGNVYTATEYHPDEVIPQHNENAYSNSWAMRIGFLCMLPAEEGGATPIADSRTVYNKIDPAIREEFEARKIMYVRNYGNIDLPWNEVFQTTERSEVERYCSANGIDWEWLDDDALRTRQVNPAVAKHPHTGESVWFNQAHLFHVSGLKEEVRESLMSVVGEDSLPRNAYFGDGEPIGGEMLDHIRAVYEETKVVFAWQKHDLMLLDNMLCTHGRTSFSGNRQVLVGMARGHGTG